MQMSQRPGAHFEGPRQSPEQQRQQEAKNACSQCSPERTDKAAWDLSKVESARKAQIMKEFRAQNNLWTNEPIPQYKQAELNKILNAPVRLASNNSSYNTQRQHSDGNIAYGHGAGNERGMIWGNDNSDDRYNNAHRQAQRANWYRQG